MICIRLLVKEEHRGDMDVFYLCRDPEEVLAKLRHWEPQRTCQEWTYFPLMDAVAIFGEPKMQLALERCAKSKFALIGEKATANLAV